MSSATEVVWVDERRFELGGSSFITTAVAMGNVEHLVIMKPPDIVRRYLALIETEQPRRIFELGINTGGSTALIALAAEPEVLLAVDLQTEIPPRLARLVETQELGGRIATAFGLDQGDRVALTAFVDEHLPDGGLDLVIDDASHLLAPTRTSFEVLFPRLRPGGLFVVEDWCAEVFLVNHLARVLPETLDFDERFAAVSKLFHVMNAPDLEVPDAVWASLAAVGAVTEWDQSSKTFHGVFERMIDIGAVADLSALDDTPFEQSRPLADLAVELMMISIARPDVITDVRLDEEWLTARRGAADIPVDSFRLDEHWSDTFGYLT